MAIDGLGDDLLRISAIFNLDQHAVARFDARDIGADGFDDARAFLAGAEGQRRQYLILALNHQQIGKIDAGRLDIDQRFVGAGLRAHVPWRAAALWGLALGLLFPVRGVIDLVRPDAGHGLIYHWLLSGPGGMVFCFAAGWRAAWRRRDFGHGGLVALTAILIAALRRNNALGKVMTDVRLGGKIVHRPGGINLHPGRWYR